MTRNPVNNDRVSDLLPVLRAEERVSQVELAKLAHLSRETINLIERDATRPKADTLRKIANGLATDGAGRHDPQKAEVYYGRLMRAADHWPRETSPVASAPEPADLYDFQAELAKRYGPENADFVEEVASKIKAFPAREAAFVRTLLLGAVRAAHPRPNNSPDGSPTMSEMGGPIALPRS